MIRITATELPRFMACNGSLAMGGIPPFDPDDTVTQEGNAAHWLVEQDFNNLMSADELVDRKAYNGIYITPDMVEHVWEYLTDLRVARAAGAGVQIETDTSRTYEDFYEISGRADAIVYSMGELTIPDFKYGWKIVEPEMNWTLISHAIGWIVRHPEAPVTKIIFTIYQPRPYHPSGPVREWSITPGELNALWIKLHETLCNPTDYLTTSPHCYKCPSMSQCPAAQIAAMNAIDVSQHRFDNTLSNEKLSWMLDQINRAKDVLKQAADAYEDLASHRLKVGEVIPQYSGTTGMGQTKWKDGVDPDMIKMLTGIDVSKKAIITPNQAKKAGVPEDVIKSFTERQSTGFKLQRVDAAKKAEQLFGKRT